MTNLATTSTSYLFAVDPKEAVSITEKVIAENGNLIKLSEVERKIYYLALCDRYGLDPFTNPFDYMKQTKWNKRTQENEIIGWTLYPNKKAAEAFGMKHNLNCRIVDRSVEDGCAIVVVEISNGSRVVQEVGAVEVTDRLGRADALKKAITQARRRGLLAFCGFSEPDTEVKGIAAEALDPPMDVMELGTAAIAEPEAIDRASIYAEIEASMKRLSWRKKDAVNCLNARYQKSTRDDLKDFELIDFNNYLKDLCDRKDEEEAHTQLDPEVVADFVATFQGEEGAA